MKNSISLTKYLNYYYGIKPGVAQNMTHQDVRQLINNIEFYSEEEFIEKFDIEQLVNFVLVRDKNGKYYLYKKIETLIEDESLIEESNIEYDEIRKYIMLIVSDLNNVNLKQLQTWQLHELRRTVKKFKKLYNVNFDSTLYKIRNEMRRKKEKKSNVKYKRK